MEEVGGLDAHTEPEVGAVVSVDVAPLGGDNRDLPHIETPELLRVSFAHIEANPLVAAAPMQNRKHW